MVSSSVLPSQSLGSIETNYGFLREKIVSCEMFHFGRDPKLVRHNQDIIYKV